MITAYQYQELSYIDDFTSKPHNTSILFNVQERRQADQDTFLVQCRSVMYISGASICIRF